jgi:hypothetical protein
MVRTYMYKIREADDSAEAWKQLETGWADPVSPLSDSRIVHAF